MVTCKLDKEVSGEILGWELPTWQALLLHRVLPSCGGLLVYLTLICFDVALICKHFLNGDNGLGIFCLFLMILPALLSLLFTLASPPPGLQTETSAFTIQIEKNDLKWIFIQIGNFFFFPVAAIGRYCHQVFWWVEAVCAARVDDEERTGEALVTAKAPSPVELYLFLQAFIHSAPHVIVNVLDMITRYSDPDFEKFSLQWVSIVTSALRMASTATVYRRFEREKICGRQYPWKTDSQILIENSNNEDAESANKVEENKEEDDHIYETLPLHRASVVSQNSMEVKSKVNSNLIQFSPRSDVTEPFFDDEGCCSDASSEYLPPVSVSRDSRPTTALDSDDEYLRPVSIIDRVAPRRRETQYTIQEVYVPPPPAVHAPRPGTLSIWAEKLVENAESIPYWLSAPERRRYYVDEVIKDEPDLPRHVPGAARVGGLEPQDASAALVHFLGWYMFFVSRLLSIAAFINFFPYAAIIILFSHYQIMLLLLIVPQASSVKRGFYIFLAFIYLFCLMEFKVRFRHVRVWHVFWTIVCTIEIVVFTGLWAGINNNLGDWWKFFIVKVIFGSMLLSYMCFLVYYVLLKPRETVVYIENKNSMAS